jgi:hypothetical protein
MVRTLPLVLNLGGEARFDHTERNDPSTEEFAAVRWSRVHD